MNTRRFGICVAVASADVLDGQGVMDRADEAEAGLRQIAQDAPWAGKDWAATYAQEVLSRKDQK